MTDIISPATGITSQRRDAIRRKTVVSLPDNPSARGYTPGQIKGAITGPLLDNDRSLVAEINRIVTELNAALAVLSSLVAGDAATVNGASAYADTLLTTDALGQRTTLRAALADLSDRTVTTSKLENGAVTEGKIGNGAVTSVKLASAVYEKILQSVTDVAYNENTGVLTFTDNEGNTQTVDLPVESILAIETKADKKTVDKAVRKLHNVAELLKGEVYGLNTGESPAYEQDVPAGAQTYAELGMVGGHSEVVQGVLVHGKCDKIITKDEDEATLTEVEIPASVLALEGYGQSAGAAYNYVDFAEKKYHRCIGKVDLGTLNWTYVSVDGRFATNAQISDVANPAGRMSNIICSIYSPGRTGTVNMTAFFYRNVLYVYNNSYTDGAAFKTAMSGVYLYYELATDVVTDISGSIPDDVFLETEVGGTVTFHQQGDTELSLPNTVTYMVKLEDTI